MKSKESSQNLFHKLRNEIKSGNVKPVYMLCGEETFFLDHIQHDILKLIAPEVKDFNLDILYGNETSIDHVLNLSRSFPMMTDRRIVIVREFLSLFDSGPGITENDNNESGSTAKGLDLNTYLEKPNPTSLLVLIDRKLPAGNTKMGKIIKSNSSIGVYNFDRINDYQLPDWIESWVKHTSNKHIDPDAAILLATKVGSDLQLLSIELDKLCTLNATKDSISIDDIELNTRISREISVFELKDAVFSRNIDKTLLIAEQLLHQSQSDVGEVIKTIAFFYSLFTNIWRIKRLTLKGLPQKQIQSQLGINNDWYFNSLVKESKKFRDDEMPGIFEALHNADIAIKGFTVLDPGAVLLIMLRRIITD